MDEIRINKKQETETLCDKIIQALSLSSEIKKILGINIPEVSATDSITPGKIASAHEGINLIIYSLEEIRAEIQRL